MKIQPGEKETNNEMAGEKTANENAVMPGNDPSQWIDEHGDFLFNYAYSRLRDDDSAEEVVQQTFFAAFKARHQYTGKGAFRAWLTGILKRKIIDFFRSRNKDAGAGLDQGTDIAEQLFDQAGKWNNDPRIFGSDPGNRIESEEFWQVFQGCLSKLPGKQGSVFFLREIDQESSDNICTTLSITASNLWVLLHRARLGLARCLKVNWDENLGENDA